MIISLIAAMDKNRVIGKEGKLPWNMPADLQYFREKTKGKPVIMGRKTFDSIGKPLANRVNIIFSKHKNFEVRDAYVVHDKEKALHIVKDEPEVMIIGGTKIFEMFFPVANRLYLTYIDAEVDGDTYFPEFNKDEWKEISRDEHKKDEDNRYDYAFVVYEKKR